MTESVGGGARGASARFFSLALLSLVLMVVVSGLALTHRGRGEMQLSDEAFDRGDLQSSIVHARRAALAYVPGATHVGSAHARLEAIARGAESEADFEIARIAWDTLRLVHVQTNYPGRPKQVSEKRAAAGLARVAKSRAEPE